MKCYLVAGNCGSGKTWVMKELIKKYKLSTLGRVGMVLFHRNEKIVVVGKYDGTTFEGSDRLSMAVMSDVPKFMAAMKGRTVVLEGDRFTNSKFIEGFKPVVIRILDDGSKGRKKRKSNQTERQLKSVATRVKKLSPRHDVLDSKIALSTLTEYLDAI